MAEDPQDDERLSVDANLLNVTILKILTVEERIEAKLDVVLAALSSSKATSPRKLAHTHAMHAVPGNWGAGMRSFQSNKSVEESFEPACSTIGVPSVWDPSLYDLESRLRKTSTSSVKLGVRMKSVFQLWVDEEVGSSEACNERRCGLPWSSRSRIHNSDSDSSRNGVLFVHIPINPNSTFLVWWSIITILVLVAQLTYVPYDMAWDVDLGVAPVCVAVFWSLDVCISFLSGTYNSEGEINSFRVSARAYALSWFPLDIFVVFLDWIFLLNLGGSDGIPLLRFSKLARLCRIMTILRISKIRRTVDRLMDMAPLANESRMILRVVYLCVSVLWYLHLTACLWFIVGRIGVTDNGERWLNLPIHMADGTMIDLSTQQDSFQYIVCFHWSVATFTLGNMEIGYANVFERLLVVALTLISFLFGSVIISMLSAIFLDHQTASMENTVKLRHLHRFLRENDVSNTLALRIQKVCSERVRVNETLTFRETTALENLPASLSKELRYEIMGRSLRKHDLFHCWSIVNIGAAEEYSVDGVEMIFLKPGDELFKANTDSEYAYFFSRGSLTYSKGDDGPFSQTALVPAETWLGEAALWSQWQHVGTCEAKARCKIAIASCDRLAHHARRYLTIRAITLSYCKFFCKGLALAMPPISELPDDVCVPFTKFAEILTHFPSTLRIFVATLALRVSKLAKKHEKKLLEGVNEGRCVAYINTDGELERSVVSTVLVLKNDEGRVLYQIGRFVPISAKNECGVQERHWKAEPEFALPCLKRDRDDLSEDTLTRLVENKINIRKEQFEYVSTLLDEEVVSSDELGVKSRNLSAKVSCSLRGAFPAKIVASEIGSGDLTPRTHPSKHFFGDSHISSEISLRKNLSVASWQSQAIHLCSASRQSAARRKLMETVSLSTLSFYLILDGMEPFIYAWLPQEAADALRQSEKHQRDEVLSELLNKVNLDAIEQSQHEEPGHLHSMDHFFM